MKFSNFKPKRSTLGSAGYDFFVPEDIEIKAKTWTTVDLGVSLEDADIVVAGQPVQQVEKWVMLLFPRSSLARGYKFRLANTVGVVDSDYRDNIQIDVWVDKTLSLSAGSKICQGVILPFGTFENEEPPTEKRAGGFGSTDAAEAPPESAPVPTEAEEKSE